ncbi:MAG: hypothetical protein NTX56_05575 [Proteobacteria bacterium]|nr:hypothetical protein [Pseudomonadota bacterium]
MTDAIARLAAELMKLPAEEWGQLDERRIASQDRETVLREAAEAEVAERLRELDRIAARTRPAEATHADPPGQTTERPPD